jgi:hypothetical protein
VVLSFNIFSSHTGNSQLSYVHFMFMGLYIVNIFKYNQQDAKLHIGVYYYKCSTCFRRFLRPSSGAQNCTHNIGYFLSLSCFLPLSWVSWNNSLTIAVRNRKRSTNTRCCVYSFELLMMGGGTVWNMLSIYSNKYRCVTLHLVGYAWIQPTILEVLHRSILEFETWNFVAICNSL